MLGNSNNEKKPVFRITSLAQNLYTSKTKEHREDSERERSVVIRRNNFSYHMVIGKGGFGKVIFRSLALG